MLFTFLTGSPYETGDRGDPSQSLARRLRLPGWKWLSPAAKDLIDQLLQKEPTRRLGLLSVLHHPFVTQASTPRLR